MAICTCLNCIAVSAGTAAQAMMFTAVRAVQASQEHGALQQLLTTA